MFQNTILSTIEILKHKETQSTQVFSKYDNKTEIR